MGTSLRKAIPSTATSRATRTPGRVLKDLSETSGEGSVGGDHYHTIVREDLTRFTELFFLEHKFYDADGRRSRHFSQASVATAKWT